MPFDPLSFGASMVPGLLGSQQVAPAAPAPNLGAQANPIGQVTPDLLQALAPPLKTNPIQDALQGFTATPEAPKEQMGPPEAPEAPNPGLLGNFIGGIDKAFSSPATLLGVGLLNQQKSGLGTAGLGVLGLINAFQNRGQ